MANLTALMSIGMLVTGALNTLSLKYQVRLRASSHVAFETAAFPDTSSLG